MAFGEYPILIKSRLISLLIFSLMIYHPPKVKVEGLTFLILSKLSILKIGDREIDWKRQKKLPSITPLHCIRLLPLILA